MIAVLSSNDGSSCLKFNSFIVIIIIIIIIVC